MIFTTFGDMMRVPGCAREPAARQGPRRGLPHRVLAPRRAQIAVDTPDREVVFFAVGFETTAPSTAVTLPRARELGVRQLLGVLATT